MRFVATAGRCAQRERQVIAKFTGRTAFAPAHCHTERGGLCNERFNFEVLPIAFSGQCRSNIYVSAAVPPPEGDGQ